MLNVTFEPLLYALLILPSVWWYAGVMDYVEDCGIEEPSSNSSLDFLFFFLSNSLDKEMNILY